MSKRFDATPKGLLEIHPADWPAFLGVPARTVEVVDADVSTVTAATDKVLLVRADEGDRMQHFDFQSGPDASIPRRTHVYSALLEERHGLPVDRVVVLLRPEANLRAINGVYRRRLPGSRRPYLHFHYRVLRVWELPVEAVLRAGISVLPLAPIRAVGQNELPAVIEQMKRRFEAEADPTTAAELWTATKVLLGLRYQAAFIERLERFACGCSGIRQNSDAGSAEFWRIPLHPHANRSIARNTCHERIDNVPGHSRRRAPGRTARRGSPRPASGWRGPFRDRPDGGAAGAPPGHYCSGSARRPYHSRRPCRELGRAAATPGSITDHAPRPAQEIVVTRSHPGLSMPGSRQMDSSPALGPLTRNAARHPPDSKSTLPPRAVRKPENSCQQGVSPALPTHQRVFKSRRRAPRTT
jgi:hypothetical protein